MADENQGTATGGQEGQQIQVALDDRDVAAVFTNSYRIFEMMDEVFIDFGYNMPHPHQQPGQPQVLLKVTHRMVMNHAAAKRLAMSLTQMVRRFEQQFGEIPMQPGQQARK